MVRSPVHAMIDQRTLDWTIAPVSTGSADGACH
jgi:hypothetical protein